MDSLTHAQVVMGSVISFNKHLCAGMMVQNMRDFVKLHCQLYQISA